MSDIHIRRFQLHDLYRRQFNLFLSDLEDKTTNYNVDEIRIVITGDIFHEKINISNEQVLLASWLFNEITKHGKLILIPGNHDFLENNMERIDSITPIIKMNKNPNIIYYKDSGVYDDNNVKWVVYSLYQHNERPDFENDGNGYYIGLFHGPIQGMSTDLGYTFDDAYDKINFRGLNILLSGDIHKRQTFKLTNGGDAIMVGSFLQNNFGESVKHHGYGIFDVETKEYTFHDLPNEQPFLHFRINDIKDIETGSEIHLNLG